MGLTAVSGSGRGVGLAVLCLVALYSRNASACECGGGGPPCQNAFQVDAVFLGTVRAMSTLGGTPDAPFPRSLVVFAIERAFRGVQDATVEVTTGMGGGDCGYAFKNGERYIVYASRSSDGRLRTSICSRTRLAAQAADDLRFLGQLSSPAVSGHVFGVVTHWHRDLAFGESKTWPVPFVHLLLRGPGAARDAQTDEHGRYDIAGVPPGIYELQAIPPAVFSARNLQHRIDIPDSRACFAADFHVLYDGRLSGVALTSDGQPAEGVQVELISGDRLWTSAERLTTKTDHDGRFEFGDLSPGRYGVGVSLRRMIDPPIAYPKTLYPGTPTETYAAILELGEGDHVQLEPLRLPPARESHQLTGVVLWPDGRPASGVSVWLDDGERTDRIVASSVRTGGDGRFKFVVHAGLSYRVRALYTLPQGGYTQRFEATDEPFVASAQLRSPRLVLAAIVGR
jgi:5-hydroxyisourate hydrolase-like protein (transthyretin family)